MRALRTFALLFLVFASCLTATSCKEVAPRSMLSLTEDERRQKFEDDLALVRRYDEGLTRTLGYAKGRPDLFVKSEEIELTPKQKRELRVIWQTVLDYMRALDAIKGYWAEFHKYGALSERRAHAESFLAGYGAWLVQYRHGLDFIELTVPSRPMEKLLDERSRKLDISEGSFAKLKWNVIHVKAVTRLLGSHQYFKTTEGALADADCDKREACAWGQDTVGDYHDGAVVALRKRGVVDFSYNAFDIARDMSFDAWFPVQRGVASWMGDTKVRRLHQHLVTREQLDGMRGHMQPGDVIVARHNWYLSNVGLPGFWPHAVQYLGSPAELADYFDDEEVAAHYLAEHGAASFPAHLEKAHPKAWAAFAANAEEGTPHRVIEAISEGVVFNSFERAAGADYVGAMRPQRSKLDKAAAIDRAFEMWGRPYDFNFDFMTDESIVCTELVYKSWRVGERKNLGVATARVMGRVTLPANDIVRQFDEQCDAPDAPLEFVYFIDGREAEKSAVVGTRESFRKSWQRPKWDTAQQ